MNNKGSHYNEYIKKSFFRGLLKLLKSLLSDGYHELNRRVCDWLHCATLQKHAHKYCAFILLVHFTTLLSL